MKLVTHKDVLNKTFIITHTVQQGGCIEETITDLFSCLLLIFFKDLCSKCRNVNTYVFAIDKVVAEQLYLATTLPIVQFKTDAPRWGSNIFAFNCGDRIGSLTSLETIKMHSNSEWSCFC